MDESLLILGNGFDCACKLNSTYINFFETRKKELGLEGISKIIEQTGRNGGGYYGQTYSHLVDKISEVKEINFWDLFFLFNEHSLSVEKYNNWSDVEKAINDFLINKKSSSSFIVKSSLRANFERLGMLNINTTLFEDATLIFAVLCKNLANSKITLSENLESTIYNEEKLNKYLLDQLKKFEACFCEFIEKRVDVETKENKYPILCKVLLSKIVSENYCHIISFNYTKPDIYTGSYNFDVSNNLNIHGSCAESNVIFGIDISSLESDSELVEFTKTFRIATEFSKGNRGLPPRETIKSIKFYGHSLAEADHAYFFSIFDYYNIYESDIELNFYYSVYGGKSTEACLNQVAMNVFKLIQKYEENISRIGQGKNLFHKLQIEGRMKIIETVLDW